MLKSVPVLISGLVQDEPAIQLWKSTDYIEQKAGHLEVTVEKTDRLNNEFAYFNKDKFSKEQMLYYNFLTCIHDEERPYNYYFAEQSIPEPLKADISVPKLASDLLHLV